MKKTAAKNELVPQFWTYDKFDYRYRKTIEIRKNCCKYFSHFPSVVATIELLKKSLKWNHTRKAVRFATFV